MNRYFLGVPFYRLEAYQALVGVPVPDATQWDQVEHVADCAYMVFEHLVYLAAQGQLIYQDYTPVRILSLITPTVCLGVTYVVAYAYGPIPSGMRFALHE